MRRPHPDLVLALAAAVMVLLLLGLAHLLEPPLTPLGEAQEGARIAVEARIVDTRGRMVTLSDGHHHLRAFLPRGSVHAERGDMIQGEGVVSRLDERLVLSLDTLTVTLPTARVIRSPAEVAASPQEFDGARIVLSGIVRAGALAGEGARVRLAGDDAPKEGDVIVTGAFRYHETDASYVLWVESWTPRL